MTQNRHRDKAKRPRHKQLTANYPEGIQALEKPRVDFSPEELESKRELLQKPVRPSNWKPKKRFVGTLSIKLQATERLNQTVPLQLTLVRAHRPRKAAETHIQTVRKSDSPDAAIAFENVPAGDYAVIFQLKGYRPFVRFVKFTRRTTTFELGSPLYPAQAPLDEVTLLRTGEHHPYVENTRRFLTRFGYLQTQCDCMNKELCACVASALRRFQQTFNLEPTGTLTIETLLLMMQPRCAFPDVPAEKPLTSNAGPPGTNAEDPIAFTGNRWDDFNLRYRLFDGTADISNEWSLIRAALDRWATVSPLSFSQVSSGSSDLEFDFRRPSESDYPFDEGGNKDGNTLAHAWGPLNGTVEFDDHEDWGSTSLPAVSTHEIGHALGLAHSSVKDATMYPWYDSGQASLHEIDVRGIKSLYAPVYNHGGPFVAFPLFAFQSRVGTDTVTINLGQVRHFLAWGTLTMIDSLVDVDRDNMSFIDIYEVDGNRTGWRVSGGDHFGSNNSPGNVYQGAYVGYGQRITFRLTAGHVGDLEVAGYAIVLVLN